MMGDARSGRRNHHGTWRMEGSNESTFDSFDTRSLGRDFLYLYI